MLFVVLNIFLASSANICLRFSLQTTGDEQLYKTLASVLLNTLSFVCLRSVMMANGLAVSQSIISSAMLVIMTLVGSFVFGEQLQFANILSILLGIMAILLNFSTKYFETPELIPVDDSDIVGNVTN